MQDGWIKLWRKSLQKGWLKNHKLWTFWCWCLMKATHKEYDQIVGFQTVHLMPGDFIFGLKVASKELNMSMQNIRTIISYLKSNQNLTIKPTNKYSIISIVNWDSYQSDILETNNQNNNLLTIKQQTTNKQLTTNKNVKNVKNVKKLIKDICIEKVKYLDCVSLSSEEYTKLIEKEGGIVITKAIEVLNNYKMSSGKQYKSDYHAILSWVIDKAKEALLIKKGGNYNEHPGKQEAEDILDRANKRFREEFAKRSTTGKDNPDP